MSTCSFLRADEARKLARNTTLLYTEICAIQSAILAAIESGQYEVFVDGQSPMTAINSVTAVNVITPGTDYFPVEATATIDHPTGVNADVTPIVTGSEITGFTINNGGFGYAPISATADVTGLGNGDATIQVIVNNSGAISQLFILNPGSGYSAGDSIPFVHPFGQGAIALVSQVSGTGGILGIDLQQGGIDYDTIFATVVITHPLGFGFVGTVQTAGGVVTGVSIQNGGDAYAPVLPAAVVSDVTGAGATLQVNVDGSTGEVTSIDVIDGGYGYSEDATVDIFAAPTSLGNGATAEVEVEFSQFGLTSPLYYDVLSGQSSDRVITDQIQFVLDYFTTLGYNIRAQVNPVTGNTLRWWIIW